MKRPYTNLTIRGKRAFSTYLLDLRSILGLVLGRHLGQIVPERLLYPYRSVAFPAARIYVAFLS
jgi:hypothetical protein